MEARNKKGQTEAEFLAEYNPSKYDRPSVTVDMLLFAVSEEKRPNYRRLADKSLDILMVRRGDHPYLGDWALPGGFVAMDESLDNAARRELREETGVETYMEQLYTFGEVGRDPRTRVISTAYMALVDSTSMKVRAGDDAEDAKWFAVTDKVVEDKKTSTDDGMTVERIHKLTLEADGVSLCADICVREETHGKVTKVSRTLLGSSGIAFDHAVIILYGLERLRNKIEWTAIAFNLMPPLFTLTDLQQVYEVILGRELLTANFRRKIAPMVTETNEHTKDAGHRPARLYRFNPNWVEEQL